mmetsp:Transcript_25399/g.73301  ORF Transcript_25399/g.73301 Transcript_25399/m.73301 type:complete len:227 (+) Transcript_25399:664-1344(+)
MLAAELTPCRGRCWSGGLPVARSSSRRRRRPRRRRRAVPSAAMPATTTATKTSRVGRSPASWRSLPSWSLRRRACAVGPAPWSLALARCSGSSPPAATRSGARPRMPCGARWPRSSRRYRRRSTETLWMDCFRPLPRRSSAWNSSSRRPTSCSRPWAPSRPAPWLGRSSAPSRAGARCRSTPTFSCWRRSAGSPRPRGGSRARTGSCGRGATGPWLRRCLWSSRTP